MNVPKRARRPGCLWAGVGPLGLSNCVSPAAFAAEMKANFNKAAGQCRGAQQQRAQEQTHAAPPAGLESLPKVTVSNAPKWAATGWRSPRFGDENHRLGWALAPMLADGLLKSPPAHAVLLGQGGQWRLCLWPTDPSRSFPELFLSRTRTGGRCPPLLSATATPMPPTPAKPRRHHGPGRARLSPAA